MFGTRRVSRRAALRAAAVLALIPAAAIAARSAHGSNPGVNPGQPRMTAYAMLAPPLIPTKERILTTDSAAAEGSGACAIIPPGGPLGYGICGTNPQELNWGGKCGGRLEIFVVGIDRAIWHTYQTSACGPWTDWSSFGGYANDGIWQIDPSGVSDIATCFGSGPCGPVMEVRGSDDNLWCMGWTPSTGWSGWSRSNCGPFI
jgi:hypothetical protein